MTTANDVTIEQIGEIWRTTDPDGTVKDHETQWKAQCHQMFWRMEHGLDSETGEPFEGPAETHVDDLEAEGWEYAGSVGVDAGMVMIGDPCYASADRRNTGNDDESLAERHPIHDWSKFCSMLEKAGYPTVLPLRYALGHEGLGVVVSSGLGDGVYPVFVRKGKVNGWGERVLEARILFIFATDDDEEEA